MKVFKLSKETTTEVCKLLAELGWWDEIAYAQVTEEELTESYFIIHDEGWCFREVGDKCGYREYDSTKISGNLTGREMKAIHPLLIKSGIDIKPGDLDCIDRLFALYA